MTELKEEHFEVISENRAREFEKKQTYKPLSDNLFIEESMIDGQGLFASKDIPEGTDLGNKPWPSIILSSKNKLSDNGL